MLCLLRGAVPVLVSAGQSPWLGPRVAGPAVCRVVPCFAAPVVCVSVPECVAGGLGGLPCVLVSGRPVRGGGLGSAYHSNLRRQEPAGS